MLGWLKRTPFPEQVEVDGRVGRRHRAAVLRPGGHSVRAPEPISGHRVVAAPAGP